MDGRMIQAMEKKLKGVKAVDIMSRFAITATEDTPLSELAHLMTRFKISGLPVTGGNGGLRGIVTATDLFTVLGNIVRDIDDKTASADHYNIPARDLMTTAVFTVTAETTLYEMLKLMCRENIHTLPVLSDGEIAGVIGRRDVLNAGYAILRSEARV